MNKRLLSRLQRGRFQNVRFEAMVQLVEAFGFRETRKHGSHRIFTREGVPEILNLQEVEGQAKPYQIKQFMILLRRYNLRSEGKR